MDSRAAGKAARLSVQNMSGIADCIRNASIDIVNRAYAIDVGVFPLCDIEIFKRQCLAVVCSETLLCSLLRVVCSAACLSAGNDSFDEFIVVNLQADNDRNTLATLR